MILNYISIIPPSKHCCLLFKTNRQKRIGNIYKKKCEELLYFSYQFFHAVFNPKLKWNTPPPVNI